MTAARRAALGEFFSSVRTIMVKELRSRFRGRRAFVVLTIYLGVLALIAYGAYVVVAPNAREDARFAGEFGEIGFDTGLAAVGANASARIGQAIFALLSVFQLLLVAFIAPAFTAGAISLEREKQTLDLLITTPLRPGAIVVGKLLSALAFVGLMMVAAVPLTALVLMYGGASVDDILRQQVVLFATAIGLGVIGLFYSALVKRTQVATVLTYCTVLALAIGTLLVWRFWTVVATNAQDNPFGQVRAAPEQLLWVNPAVAMVEVVANTEANGGDFSTIMWLISNGTDAGIEPRPVILQEEGARLELLKGPPPRFAGDGPLDEPEPELAAVIDPSLGASNHFWPRFSLTFAALSLLLTFASMRLIVPAGIRFALWRPRHLAISAPGAALPEAGIEEIEP